MPQGQRLKRQLGNRVRHWYVAIPHRTEVVEKAPLPICALAGR